MAGWSLATRVGACGAALAEDVYPRDGIAGLGGGLLCGSLSTDTDVRRALSFRTGMAQYSQRRLRRPSGHIHPPHDGAIQPRSRWAQRSGRGRAQLLLF